MRIYNTLTRKKDELKPTSDQEITMYVCGPTVYDYDHLGHARVGIFYDTLKRFLSEQGYKVKYAQNITDVGHLTEDTGEDKIEKKAKQEKVDPIEIARRFEKAHFQDMAVLNCQKPDFSPRASEYMEKIIDFIKALIKKEYAYEASGNVYFDVSRLLDYGKVSGRDFKLQDKHRVEPGEGKKDPADFALWISADPDHILKYKSPWSEGYPGWHIECSVMNQNIFGPTVDIHGGAVELAFPHHENEVAQSKAYSGVDPVRFFVHIGMVTIDGEKMSKSKGNYVLIRDIVKKYDADTIRIFILKTYYRSPIDYSEKNMKAAQIIKVKLTRAGERAKEGSKSEISNQVDKILNDDFNTAKALNYILDNLNQLNRGDFEHIKKIFGLRLIERKTHLTDDQKKLIQDREEARANNDFKKADQIRNDLKKQGIEIEDTQEGSKVVKK